MSHFVLHQAEEAIANYLTQNQLGFTPSSNGAQSAIYTVREWAKDMHTNLLCNVDRCNAFNNVSRRACCAALIDIDPLLDSWSRWSLSAAVPVVSDGYTFVASTSVL